MALVKNAYLPTTKKKKKKQKPVVVALVILATWEDRDHGSRPAQTLNGW
jgi:hypothetical protein